MDIHDSPLKPPQEFPFQNPHETRQYHQFDAGLFEGREVTPFGFVVQFGAKFARKPPLDLPGTLLK